MADNIQLNPGVGGDVLAAQDIAGVKHQIVVAGGYSDTGNSTTTPLDAGATYTGVGVLNAFPDVMVSMKSDQSGTIYMDFSPDGTNWDSSLSFKYDPSLINPPHILVKGSRYYRTRYQNTSASTQGTMRLDTSFGSFQKLTSPLGGSIAANADALIVRPSNTQLDLARGIIQGQSQVAKFGHIANINTVDTPEDVWNSGSDYTGHPTGVAETIQVFSSDTGDAAAGQGARQVTIYGLESSDSMAETSEVVSLSGTTPVISSNTWYRVYRATCGDFGNDGINAGSITIRHSSTTENVFALVPAGQGQTTVAAFTIPAGHTGYLTSVYAILARSAGTAGSAQLSLRVREFGDGGFVSKRYYGVTTSLPVSPPTPMYAVSFPEKSDIKIRIESVSDNGSEISADFDIIVVKD